MYLHTQPLISVILIGTTIARLLDGSPANQGKKTDPVDEPVAKGATPLKIALDTSNIITIWSARRAPCRSMRQETRGAARTSTTAAISCSTCSTT